MIEATRELWIKRNEIADRNELLGVFMRGWARRSNAIGARILDLGRQGSKDRDEIDALFAANKRIGDRMRELDRQRWALTQQTTALMCEIAELEWGDLPDVELKM